MKYLLLPILLLLSIIYGCITGIRNWLFDKEILPSRSFNFPIIGVGNLSTGGTGKTPMVELITNILRQYGYKIAILSRGYGRNTKGVIIANPQKDTAQTIGDEPYQYLQKFHSATIVVAEKRVDGVQELISQNIDFDVLILDDCIQHRYISVGYMIMLSDFSKPFFKDFLLPLGRL